MVTTLVFIILIAVLVIVHEAGHFLAAKKGKIGVEEFAFGFPPRLVSKKYKGTTYSLNLIPLGGYVKLHGEDKKLDKKSFLAKSVFSRFKVISAGVLMNLLLGLALLVVYLSFGGGPIATDISKYPFLVREYKLNPVVVKVLPDSAAASWGLKSGDIILKLNDQEVNKAQDFSEFTFKNPDKKIRLTIERAKEIKNFEGIIPNIEGHGRIGVELSDFFYNVKVKPWAIPLLGIIDFFNILKVIILFFWDLIVSIFYKTPIPGGITGPVGVYLITKEAVNLGFIYILKLAILLNLNLAIINFLPLPALDGGRALFLLVEKIKGRAVKKELEEVIHLIGFFIIIILVIIITVKDILKLL